jgi:sulfate transport system permease protein
MRRTMFVSVPFVAREIIPVIEAAGNDEEEAACVMGEFGAVSLLSGHIPGLTNALPRPESQ